MAKKIWLILFFALALVGCAPMEQHSEGPEKKKLDPLETTVPMKRKWTLSSGRGAGKSDVKLGLVEYGNNLITVDQDGRVVAVNSSNGALVWFTELNTPVSSGPSVGDDRIIVGTNSGKVIALNAKDGKQLWASPATSEVLAPACISDGVAYVHAMDGSFSAYSLEDGRQLWRFSHQLPALVLRSGGKPVATSQYVIAGFSTGKLLAVRKIDGTIEWSQDVGHPRGRTELQRMVDISSDPIVKDDVVYAVSYQGDLVALNINNGQIIWNRNISSYAGFALDRNILYVAATNGDVVAVDAVTGHTFWLQDELQGRRLSKPAVMGKYIIVCDTDGVVHLLDRHTGKLVGRYQYDRAGVEATPIIHKNIVYLLGRRGKLAAVEVG
jgi:outer membrane protein assembly factor BamB